MRYTLLAMIAGLSATAWGVETRIKDITDVEGVRGNVLSGVGLVTGLNGTGGKNPETRQFVLNVLQRFGNRADSGRRLAILLDAQQKTDNLSAVALTAELPAFAAPGLRFDVTVSTLDDAESLNGGILFPSPLFGIDGEPYAMASGEVIVSGLSAAGDAATVVRNIPTVGIITGGATAEEVVPYKVGECGYIRFLVRNADFETAKRIARAINSVFPLSARAQGAGIVHVQIPEQYLQDIATFVAMVEALRVEPDFVARVVINERSGTVVAGQHVRVSEVMITHGNLTISASESPEVSQPEPFSDGRTVAVPRTELDVVEERRPIHVLDESGTVADLARALNALGATPRDLASIFQRLDEAGALHGELIFK